MVSSFLPLCPGLYVAGSVFEPGLVGGSEPSGGDDRRDGESGAADVGGGRRLYYRACLVQQRKANRAYRLETSGCSTGRCRIVAQKAGGQPHHHRIVRTFGYNALYRQSRWVLFLVDNAASFLLITSQRKPGFFHIHIFLLLPFFFFLVFRLFFLVLFFFSFSFSFSFSIPCVPLGSCANTSFPFPLRIPFSTNILQRPLLMMMP